MCLGRLSLCKARGPNAWFSGEPIQDEEASRRGFK